MNTFVRFIIAIIAFAAIMIFIGPLLLPIFPPLGGLLLILLLAGVVWWFLGTPMVLP